MSFSFRLIKSGVPGRHSAKYVRSAFLCFAQCLDVLGIQINESWSGSSPDKIAVSSDETLPYCRFHCMGYRLSLMSHKVATYDIKYGFYRISGCVSKLRVNKN